jgi:hypothetical protein
MDYYFSVKVKKDLIRRYFVSHVSSTGMGNVFIILVFFYREKIIWIVKLIIRISELS